MGDEELIALKKQWLASWDKGGADLKKWQDENEKYWLGNHFGDTGEERPLVDNLIFESLETFLPIATKRNPEPTVDADNTPAGNQIADTVKKFLVYHADRLRLKLKLKRSTRHWAIYHLGVAKISWSTIENDLTVSIIRPQKLILDPDAPIEEGEYKGDYIGEYRDDTAANLIKRFPKKSSVIKKFVNEKLGTKLRYIEWWSDDYVFWTLGDEVLAKSKNPHFNYEGRTTVDETGAPVQLGPQNHFPVPKKPYVLLSVFSLGKHPYDDTSLIKQNLAPQDLVNKRQRQIDKNADSQNNGIVLSGDHFTKEQAAEASDVLKKGGALFVPSGDVNTAYKRDQAPQLPTDVYNQLADTRNEIRNVFGTRGSSPQGTINEQTVRGKIITKGQDADRASLIADYLEQFADQIFNWMVQMMYVYYDEEHTATIVGKERTRETISLQNEQLDRKLTISVKEGSLIPKDSLTERNEAIDLATAGFLNPITLFDRLEFPNPREAAKQLWLWQNAPQMLFEGDPQVAAVIMQQQQAAAQEQAMKMQGKPDEAASDSLPSVDTMLENQGQT